MIPPHRERRWRSRASGLAPRRHPESSSVMGIESQDEAKLERFVVVHRSNS